MLERITYLKTFLSYLEKAELEISDKEEALSFLYDRAPSYFMVYAEPYYILRCDNTPLFVPDISFETIECDILFDEELRATVLEGANKVRLVFYDSCYSYLGKDTNYRSWQELYASDFLDVIYDYEYLSKEEQEKIASLFMLDSVLLSEVLREIEYVYSLSYDSKELLDRVFIDKVPSENGLDMEYQKDKVGALFWFIDYLLYQGKKTPYLNKARELLLKYEIAPTRIGLNMK